MLGTGERAALLHTEPLPPTSQLHCNQQQVHNVLTAAAMRETGRMHIPAGSGPVAHRGCVEEDVLLHHVAAGALECSSIPRLPVDQHLAGQHAAPRLARQHIQLEPQRPQRQPILPPTAGACSKSARRARTTSRHGRERGDALPAWFCQLRSGPSEPAGALLGSSRSHRSGSPSRPLPHMPMRFRHASRCCRHRVPGRTCARGNRVTQVLETEVHSCEVKSATVSCDWARCRARCEHSMTVSEQALSNFTLSTSRCSTRRGACVTERLTTLPPNSYDNLSANAAKLNGCQLVVTL
jgi:hypothetical protein